MHKGSTSLAAPLNLELGESNAASGYEIIFGIRLKVGAWSLGSTLSGVLAEFPE
jgi:hypothetical protein